VYYLKLARQYSLASAKQQIRRKLGMKKFKVTSQKGADRVFTHLTQRMFLGKPFTVTFKSVIKVDEKNPKEN